MPINFNAPAITDNYVSAFVPRLNENLRALGQWLDPAVAGVVSNAPTGTYRLNAGSVERFNGTSWVSQSINGINFVGGNIGFGGITAPSARLEADLSGASGVTQTLRAQESPASVPVGGLGASILLGWGSVNVGLRTVHGGDGNNAGIAFQAGAGGVNYEVSRFASNGYLNIGSGAQALNADAPLQIRAGGDEKIRVNGSLPFMSFWNAANTQRYAYIWGRSDSLHLTSDVGDVAVYPGGVQRAVFSAGSGTLNLQPAAGNSALIAVGNNTANTVEDFVVYRTGVQSFIAGQGASLRLGNATQASDVLLQGAGANFQLFTKVSPAGWSERLRITELGHTLAGANNAQDIGSTSLHWRRLHTYNIERSDTGPLTIASAGAGGQIDLSVAGSTRYRVGSTGRSQFIGGAYTGTAGQPFAASAVFNAETSNVHEFTGPMSGNVTSCTINNGVGGQTISIRVKQDANGGRTFASPAGSKITGTISLAPNAPSILTLTYSATDARWEGSWLQLPP